MKGVWRFLGKGWKTVSGAAVWAVGHAGLVTAVGGAVGISGTIIDEVLTKVGAALVVVGLAHKVERLDKTTPSE